MTRNILFITTDQQRYDSLGCNGGRIARTPVADRWAAEGINYDRAHCQNVVCTPSRVTMFNGQHPRTHGVVSNGIPFPDESPGVAGHLKRNAGYRTALIGKSHFHPGIDPGFRFRQNQLAHEGSNGPWLGFDHLELAMHGPVGSVHYSKWILEEHPEHVAGFAALLTAQGGGETGAPEVAYNPIPREYYHTDWVADRTIRYLERIGSGDPWFVWMSFPDPHHPWDPPASIARRIDWRDLDLPPGHPGSHEKILGVLRQKPQHWLDWYLGKFANPEGGPSRFVPCEMTHDQVREINALIHIENELIDEACGRVLDHLEASGQAERTDIFFTTDHGELQGDFGLMFKGPYHVDSLMRLPLIWRPAPAAAVAPARIPEPVGLIDLSPTFCAVAGLPVPDWMQGEHLPLTPGSGRKRVITTWDSQFRRVGMHLTSIFTEGYTLTSYERSTTDRGGRFPLLELIWGDKGRIPAYAGHEGELYDLAEDPHQWRNLWDDPDYRQLRSDLLAELRDHRPPERAVPLEVAAPV